MKSDLDRNNFASWRNKGLFVNQNSSVPFIYFRWETKISFDTCYDSMVYWQYEQFRQSRLFYLAGHITRKTA